MKSKTIALFVLAASRAIAQNATDYTQYVNLFLGTTDGGNMFPGVVSSPFAMVKLGPDVDDGASDAYSGYLPKGELFGFSMMHESGTGGAPKYGVVSQMPAVGRVANPLVDLGLNRTVNDTAEVGYYESSLDGGLGIEIAATERAGMYQYTLPEGENSIVVDVSHVLPSYRGFGWGQGYAGGSFRIANDGHYEGHGIYNNGWNLAPNWTIHFCGYFDQKPITTSTFTGNATELYTYNNTVPTNGTYRQGGVFIFSNQTVTSRVGISFISSAQACNNVQREIPQNTTLTSLVERAQTAWSTQVFDKVRVSSSNTTTLTQLYSYLYGMHIVPSNRTGENPLWDSTEPYYDDIFTFWDLFRCGTPLMQVLQPAAYSDQIRSLVDIWRYGGWLPDARSSNYNGRVQGGSNADNVLADAYVKHVPGVNWMDAYSAMRTDAEVQPPNNNDPISPASSTKEGRGALPDWLQYGYITPTYNRAVSRAVEYSANDFGLYQLASGLNKTDEASTYLNRSRNWRNHWNANQTSLGFSGFVVPRFANGSFEYPYDPLQCGGCYWTDPFYEDNPWTYSFNAHHDLSHLVQLSGGRERFVERLEKFFELGVYDGNEAFGSTLFNIANEPGFTTPYLFNFVGRQDLSVKYSRRAAGFYGAGTDGLPGNSDAGAMQTWALWSMIGLYPLTGQITFLIGSPWFEELTIDLGQGKTLSVTSVGGNGGAEEGNYVQSLKVNGLEWNKAWVTWADVFAEGGRMEFVLGAEPVRWATGEDPPSPASL